MTAGEQRQLNVSRLMEILRRYVPSTPNLTDTQLVTATTHAFWYERENKPLIDPNE